MTNTPAKDTGVATDRRYSFICPPGWFRLDLRQPTSAQVRRLADIVLEQRPSAPNQAQVRVALIAQLTRSCEAAAASEVLDLVLPVEVFEGAMMPASWAFLPLDVPDGADPIELLAGIAGRNPSASLMEVHDLVALRIESRTQKPTDDLDRAVDSMAADLGVPRQETDDHREVWTQRVQYFLGHPQRPDGWIVVTASITDSGGEDAEVLTPALVELFDEVVKTVRFPDA